MLHKNKPFSLHLNPDLFQPATDAEKEYISQMRPSTTFFKDGVKRLLKNKVATISFILIIVITVTCVILPYFWPYSYEQQLGQRRGKPMDRSFNNLAPFTYGKTELQKIEDGEFVMPISWAPTLPAAIISSAWSTAPAFPWPSASLPALSY